MRFKKFFGLAFAVLAVAGIVRAPAVLAQGSDAFAAETQTLTGEVMKADPAARTLSVQTGLFATQEFTVEDRADVSNSSGPIRLEELKAGDKVTVSYVESRGRKLAGSVTVDDVTPPPSL